MGHLVTSMGTLGGKYYKMYWPFLHFCLTQPERWGLQGITNHVYYVYFSNYPKVSTIHSLLLLRSPTLFHDQLAYNFFPIVQFVQFLGNSTLCRRSYIRLIHPIQQRISCSRLLAQSGNEGRFCTFSRLLNLPFKNFFLVTTPCSRNNLHNIEPRMITL